MIERNLYRIMLAAAIGYIFFLQMCGTRCSCPDPVITSVKIDTGKIIEQFKSSWQKPEPDTVIPTGEMPAPVPLLVFIDTGRNIIHPADTAAILKDYFAKAYYRDTLHTKYGAITVEDTISQNRIQARRWATDFTIPTITRTVTLAVAPRNQLYVGFSGLMGQYQLGGEINLSLKTKKDQQYEIGGGLLGTGWYGRVGTKFKLSFK